MTLPEDNEHDETDGLLETPGRPLNGCPLRESLYEKTAAVVRTRRRQKQAGRALMVACLVACVYATGIATSALWLSGRPAESMQPTPQVVSDDHEKAAVQPTTKEGKPAPKKPPAVAAKKSRFEVNRDAGDETLQQSDDLALAVRRYAKAVEHATPEELSIAPDRDHWLLMALKEARSKEISHERRVPN